MNSDSLRENEAIEKRVVTQPIQINCKNWISLVLVCDLDVRNRSDTIEKVIISV
jgi:predicted nucleic-acid-binding protein